MERIRILQSLMEGGGGKGGNQINVIETKSNSLSFPSPLSGLRRIILTYRKAAQHLNRIDP